MRAGGWIRDRSAAYYAHAIETGTITLNGKIAPADTIIRNGDLLRNVVHRHEPPVIGDPVRIVHRDEARGMLVVEKPGSMPVHVTGRYKYNTLLEVLKHDYDLPIVYTVNRLDRLTSGIMIVVTNKDAARDLATLFGTEGAVKKEYVCRVTGCFPDEEITCDQPILQVDRQLGINVIHPHGRHACTIFQRISYHAPSNTSVIHCRPITGRTHQIRVHLQYLGFPIANDPIYNSSLAWGASNGRGGVFRDPDTAHEADLVRARSDQLVMRQRQSGLANARTLPTIDNLETGAAITLSDELKTAITVLRQTRDADDGFARYKDMLPTDRKPSSATTMNEADFEAYDEHGKFCRLCGVPLLPDPKPAQLCIWLHAKRYSSVVGGWDFESDKLPSWADEDWVGWETALADVAEQSRPFVERTEQQMAASMGALNVASNAS